MVSDPNSHPAYNVKAVTKETGLGPDTLRAWERRYGVPQPERTAGRQRLYSRRDVDLLKWLIQRQHEGLSISRAVEAFRGLVATGEDPLSTTASGSGGASRDGSVDGLRTQWLDYCLNLDASAADALLSEAFAIHPLEAVCAGILQAGVAELGDRWHQGAIKPYQEHFATALASRQIERLIAASPRPDRGERVLIACPKGEMHAFGSLLLTLLLRRHGWGCIFLGADVPTYDLVAATRQARPAAILLSAQRLQSAATLAEAATTLAGLDVTVGYGGRIFALAPSLKARIPAIYLDDHLVGVPVALDRALQSGSRAAAPESATHALARAHFAERRSIIEADALANLPADASQRAQLDEIAAWLARAIDASLALGDMSVLPTEVEWAVDHASLSDAEPDVVGNLVRAYARAAERHLDAPGAVVIQCLNDVCDQSQDVGARSRATEAIQ